MIEKFSLLLFFGMLMLFFFLYIYIFVSVKVISRVFVTYIRVKQFQRNSYLVFAKVLIFQHHYFRIVIFVLYNRRILLLGKANITILKQWYSILGASTHLAHSITLITPINKIFAYPKCIQKKLVGILESFTVLGISHRCS